MAMTMSSTLSQSNLISPVGLAAATTSVKVAVRIRPMTARELLSHSGNCVSVLLGTSQLVVGIESAAHHSHQYHHQGGGSGHQQKSFTFDHVFDRMTAQENVYKDCILPLVEKHLEGFNATVLAYGQTGSGKTYTMGIGFGVHQQGDEVAGIVPRAIHDLFRRLHAQSAAQHKQDTFKFEMYCSFLELYNEDLIDLLDPRPKTAVANAASGVGLGLALGGSGGGGGGGGSSGGPTIREDMYGNIVWLGIKEEQVQTPEDLLSCLQRGSLCRTTGSTDMNATSSRSHAIFSIILKQQRWIDGSGGNAPSSEDAASINSPTPGDSGNGYWQTTTSKFHFVDLAGSERLKRTNAEGDRKKEGISINQGLLALGNVISALGDEHRKVSHVPYRDSRLTRMLQDSLGGNSQTLMLACISPSDMNYAETVNTLNYANRARNIKNKVSVNHEFSGGNAALLQEKEKELRYLRSVVSQLQQENSVLRGGSSVNHLPTIPLSPSQSAVASCLPFPYHQGEKLMMMSDNARASDKLERHIAQIEHERTKFRCSRLYARVKELLAEYAAVVSDRDTVFATKLRYLQLHESTSSTGAGGGITPLTGVDHVSAVEVISTLTKKIQDYADLVASMQIKLADADDKISWYNEMIAKFAGKKVDRDYDGQDEMDEELNLPKSPENRQLAKILFDIKEGKSENQMMRFFRSAPPDTPAVLALRSNKILEPLPPSNLSNELDFGMTHDGPSDESPSSDANEDVYVMIHKIQSDIAEHEALMARIHKRDAEYEFMKKAYEQKLMVLQNQLVQYQKEKDMALAHMQNSSDPKFASSANIAIIKNKFEDQRRKLEREIIEYKKRLGENSRLQNSNRAQNGALSRNLTMTIEALKREKAQMLKELRKGVQAHRESTLASQREIARLKRKEKTVSEVAKRLERSNQLQRVVLKKKMEEIASSQTKLKDVMALLKKSNSSNSRVSKVAFASGSTSPVLTRSASARAGKRSSTPPLATLPILLSGLNMGGVGTKVDSTQLEVRVAFKKQMLDKELASCVTSRRAQKVLIDLRNQRERLENEKEELLQERRRIIIEEKKLHKDVDEMQPRYMDERLDIIDEELGLIHTRMKMQEHVIAGAMGVSLSADSGIQSSEDPESPVVSIDELTSPLTGERLIDMDLGWENALNLIRSLSSNEQDVLSAMVLEDLIQLRVEVADKESKIQEQQKQSAELRQTLLDTRKAVRKTSYDYENRLRGLISNLQKFKLGSPVKVVDTNTSSGGDNRIIDLEMYAQTLSSSSGDGSPVVASKHFDSPSPSTASNIFSRVFRNSNVSPVSKSPIRCEHHRSSSVSLTLDSAPINPKLAISPGASQQIGTILDVPSGILNGSPTSSPKHEVGGEDPEPLDPLMMKGTSLDFVSKLAGGKDVFIRLANAHTQASQAKKRERSDLSSSVAGAGGGSLNDAKV